MTWLWLCIMVSSTIVSPEFTRSTGGCALSNQPHCVVSSVAGRRCIFLPFGIGRARSAGSAGPVLGSATGVAGGGVDWAAGGGGARTITPVIRTATAAAVTASAIVVL